MSDRDLVVLLWLALYFSLTLAALFWGLWRRAERANAELRKQVKGGVE